MMKSYLCLGAALALGLAASAASAGGPKLDKKFDRDGKVTTPFDAFTGASAVALQEDGKIVVAGSNATGDFMAGFDYDFAVARYNTDGSLDTGFDGDGRATTDFGTPSDLANAVAIQPSDGKIVVAGLANLQLALARYNTDGTPDMDFSGDGKTTFLVNSNCRATAVAIQPSDGKIVVAGNGFTGSGNNFLVARFDTDGTPDDTFGTDGAVSMHFTALPVELGNALLLASNGTIVVAGQAYSNFNGALNDFLVVRYDGDDGDVDASFGTGGFRQIDFNPDEEAALALAEQRDGKILAAGFTVQNNGGDFAIARLDTDGDLDPTFGSGGKQTTDFAAGAGNGDHANAILIQPGLSLATDKIILAGSAFIGTKYDFALSRYSIDGVLDTKFGKKGKLLTAFAPDSNDRIEGLARQADGKLVAAGGSGAGGGSSTVFAVARYKAK